MAEKPDKEFSEEREHTNPYDTPSAPTQKYIDESDTPPPLFQSTPGYLTSIHDDFENEASPPLTTEELQNENERLKKMLQYLLLQESQNSTDTHPRLFRLNMENLHHFDPRALIDPYAPTTTTTTNTSTPYTTNNPNIRSIDPQIVPGDQNYSTSQFDDYVITANYNILNELTSQLNANLIAQSTTTTTTTTTTTPSLSSFTTSSNMNRQTQTLGPADQASGFELPGVPEIQQHYVEEIPSITSVQNDYFNSTAQVTVVTQQERVVGIAEGQSPSTRETWQEALVIDVPRGDFWVLIPSDLNIREREEFLQQQRHELDLLDSTDYDEHRTVQQRQLLIDNRREQFGTVIPDGFDDHELNIIQGDATNHGYVMLDASRIQEHLSEYIMETIRNLPEAYTLNKDEIVEALRVASHIQEAHLAASSSEPAPRKPDQPTSPQSIEGNDKKSAKITPTTYQKVKDKTAADAAAANAAKQGPTLTSASLAFLHDCMKNGKIDSNAATRYLIPPIINQSPSWFSSLYSYGTWAYSLWSWASIPYSIYRNPVLSRTVVSWVYRGVCYALVFLI